MREFDSISVSTYEAESLAPKLTERSAAGWEVVSIVSAGSAVTAYLSREASAETASADSTDEPTAVSASSPDSTELGPVGDADLAASGAAGSGTPWSSGAGVADIPDTPSIDTPSVPEPEPVDTTPAPTLGGAADPVADAPGYDAGGASLADEAAALGSQTSTEPTAEPGGWAATSSEATSDASATQPAADTSSQATEQQSSAATAPAGWYADPSGRFELRYWDGGQWTEHVSRAGQQYTDPPVA